MGCGDAIASVATGGLTSAVKGDVAGAMTGGQTNMMETTPGQYLTGGTGQIGKLNRSLMTSGMTGGYNNIEAASKRSNFGNQFDAFMDPSRVNDSWIRDSGEIMGDTLGQDTRKVFGNYIVPIVAGAFGGPVGAFAGSYLGNKFVGGDDSQGIVKAGISAGTSVVGSAAGSYIGPAVSSAVTSATNGAVSGAAANAIGNAVASAASNAATGAATAAATGRDPGEAAWMGAATGAAGSLVNSAIYQAGYNAGIEAGLSPELAAQAARVAAGAASAATRASISGQDPARAALSAGIGGTINQLQLTSDRGYDRAINQGLNSLAQYGVNQLYSPNQPQRSPIPPRPVPARPQVVRRPTPMINTMARRV